MKVWSKMNYNQFFGEGWFVSILSLDVCFGYRRSRGGASEEEPPRRTLCIYCTAKLWGTREETEGEVRGRGGKFNQNDHHLNPHKQHNHNRHKSSYSLQWLTKFIANIYVWTCALCIKIRVHIHNKMYVYTYACERLCHRMHHSKLVTCIEVLSP